MIHKEGNWAFVVIIFSCIWKSCKVLWILGDFVISVLNKDQFLILLWLSSLFKQDNNLK